MTATTSNRYKWQVAAVIAGSMMFAGIDVGGALVALPTIAADFDADLPAVQWVALMRLLGLSALLLPAGRVADLVGRKKVALTGIVVLGAGGVLAALAPTLPLLIAARGLQSLAEAALQVRGMAGDHQVDGARRAFGHAYGGGAQYFAMWVVGADKP